MISFTRSHVANLSVPWSMQSDTFQFADVRDGLRTWNFFLPFILCSTLHGEPGSLLTLGFRVVF